VGTGSSKTIFEEALMSLYSLMEWYEIYKDTLLEDWNVEGRHEPLNKIPPLKYRLF